MSRRSKRSAFTPLEPRQRILSSPNSLYARFAAWGRILDLPAGFDDNVDNDSLATLICANNEVATYDDEGWECAGQVAMATDSGATLIVHNQGSSNVGLLAQAEGTGTAVLGQTLSGAGIGVEGKVSSFGGIGVRGTAGSNGTADPDGSLEVDGEAGDVPLWIRSGGSTKLKIATNGYTVVGQNVTPGFQLHVTGDGSAGKPGGGSWSVTSDARLKRDVENLIGALDSLTALCGVSFEYIDPEAIHELPGPRLGMIAQEVEMVFPDRESTGPSGYKRLSYRGFEALTVEAFRELREEKDAEIRRLEERLDELEALMESMLLQAQQETAP